MGVEFKLGRRDHKKVEDFLARRPAGVAGISIDASLIRYQAGAAEAARAANVDVVVEPHTERLVAVGFEPEGLPYYHGHPIDLAVLRRASSARRELVEQVLEVQHEVATRLVPPHFYVEDDASAHLNLALALDAAERAGATPVRPILVIRRKFAVTAAADLADAYAQLGVEELDLRVTPFGGDDESTQKIRSVFGVADSFRDAGIDVMLGSSGNIGQAALALGHATRYSVGVGMKERLDHVSAMSRQARPVDDNEGAERFGPQAGVYLPGPAATVRRPIAQAMLADREIRTRIGCRLGSCRHDIGGPATDPRDHYLHARSHEAAQLLDRPRPWRATMEHDRLQRAVDLREIINRHHLPDGAYPLKTRTLRSVLDDIEHEQRMTA